MPLVNRRTYSVAQINEYARSLLHADPILSDVSVRGEISNLRPHRSGHVYFTIKDGEAVLSCALFRQNARQVTVALTEGMQIVARGYVTIYPRDGAYQLVVSQVQADGVGALFALFEKRRAQYQAQGLFDPARKKKLPEFARRIAVVTSPTGAVLRDIVRVARARWRGIEICLVPTDVQGAQAAQQIARAVLCADGCGADVIIVGRGGGSLEDLWAFNEEAVVAAVAACKTPVVSAVGHETDFTLCDFAADVRASTPSNAAELCVADAAALAHRVNMLRQRALRAPANLIALRRERLLRARQRATRAMQVRLDTARHAVAALENRPVLRQPGAFLTILRGKCAALASRAVSAQKKMLDQYRGRVAFCAAAAPRAFERMLQQRKNVCRVLRGKAQALDPMSVLGRGYALVRQEGRVVTKAAALAPGMQVELTLSDGSRKAEVLP